MDGSNRPGGRGFGPACRHGDWDVVAEQCDQLTVFQRTPNFSFRAGNQPMDPDFISDVKSRYPAYRDAQPLRRSLGERGSQRHCSRFRAPENPRHG